MRAASCKSPIRSSRYGARLPNSLSPRRRGNGMGSDGVSDRDGPTGEPGVASAMEAIMRAIAHIFYSLPDLAFAEVQAPEIWGCLPPPGRGGRDLLAFFHVLAVLAVLV